MRKLRLWIPWLCLGLGGAAAAQGAPAITPSPVAANAQSPATNGPVLIDLDQAIQLGLDHAPSMLAERTQIPQSQAQEVTAGLKPNPVLNWDALYLPVFQPGLLTANYLDNSAEYDASVAYLHERGGKREARVVAAKDATAVVAAQVNDSARSLTFNIAQQFLNALLAKANLDFSQQDLASWQNTVNISQAQYKAGAMSEGDLDTVRLQTLQYQMTVSGARLSQAQALIALRQAVGFSAVPANFDASGTLVYQPIHGNVDDFKNLALQDRPDLIAARAGVNAAKSQYALAKADAKVDLTITTQYSHLSALNDLGFLFSIPLPVYDRNQGEIARTNVAVTQAQDQAQQANEQVLTDVATAFEAVQEGDQIIKLYDAGYRDQAKEALDIRQYSYSRGASSLLDLLDAERTYRSTELGYRQALATYMLAVEQLKEAVGTRTLP